MLLAVSVEEVGVMGCGGELNEFFFFVSVSLGGGLKEGGGKCESKK
jgi:hypothetical protein